MPVENTFLESGTAIVTDFAAAYGPQALIVLGLAIAIGLGIWGTIKIVGLFRKSAS